MPRCKSKYKTVALHVRAKAFPIWIQCKYVKNEESGSLRKKKFISAYYVHYFIPVIRFFTLTVEPNPGGMTRASYKTTFPEFYMTHRQKTTKRQVSDIKKDDGCCTYLLSTTHTQLHISPVYGKKSSCSQGFFQNKSCKFSPKPFSFTTWLHFYCLVATDRKYQKNIFCQCHLEQALLSGLTHNIILPIMHTAHMMGWGNKQQSSNHVHCPICKISHHK